MSNRVLFLFLVLAPLVAPRMPQASAEAPQAASPFQLATLVKRGDPGPDGGRLFDGPLESGVIAGLHGLSSSGHLTIQTTEIGPNLGICGASDLLVARGKVQRIANFCHDTPLGPLSLLGPANVNSAGQVVVLGSLDSDPKGNVLFLYADGQLQKLVQSGDQIPAGVVGTLFSEPSINENGDIAYSSSFINRGGLFGIFLAHGGQIQSVAVDNDPLPDLHVFFFHLTLPAMTWLNNNGDVLFQAEENPGFLGGCSDGLFLSTKDGFKRVEFGCDQMPAGGKVVPDVPGLGTLNDNDEVAFSVPLQGGSSSYGIFFWSGGTTSTVAVLGDPTPVGGRFKTFFDPMALTFGVDVLIVPRINNHGAIAFQADIRGGSTSNALFLASAKSGAILKVVGVGDQVPSGETIREISSFALNDLGQVAFFAFAKGAEQLPLGFYLATPIPPAIGSIKLKGAQGNSKLIINGDGFITKDSIIRINGQAVLTEYPAGFQEDGGTATRLISRDPALAQLPPAGQMVQVTVSNPLTGTTSVVVNFSR